MSHATATPRDWRARSLWALIGAVTLAKVPLAAIVPLSGDEAYYYDCSRHLDWCYFDQPGLVIWSMIPARALLGDTALAVRAPALLASALFGLFCVRIVLELGGSRRQAGALWGLLHATPLFFVGSAYAATDSMMLAAYAAATWSAMVLARGDDRGFWGFGAAVGLGFLGKYTIVLALPMLLPALWRRGAGALRAPTPWLAAGLCGLLTAPVWIWATQHHWDNVRFQFARVPTGFRPLEVALFLAGSLALATPTIGFAIAAAFRVSLRTRPDAPWRVFRWAVATPLVFWSLLAARGPVSLHWGAPSVLLGLAAVVLLDFPWRRALVRAGIATTAVVLPLALSVPLFPDAWMGVERRFREWQGRVDRMQLPNVNAPVAVSAELVRRLRPGELAVSQRYSYVHLVSFLTQGRVETALFRGANHGLASLYWRGTHELLGRDALVFTTDAKLDDELRPLFESVEEEAPFAMQHDGEAVQSWRFFRCHNLLRPAPSFTRLTATE